MIELKIEKGVPLPEPDKNNRSKSHAAGRNHGYGWHQLEVGDSVLLKSESARCAALQWAPRNGAVFTSRKIPREGWRVWRLA